MREWQSFGMSPLAHLVDVERPVPRRSGPRTVCGRYPGRNVHPWWALSESEMAGKNMPSGLSRCPDCAAAHPEVGSNG